MAQIVTLKRFEKLTIFSKLTILSMKVLFPSCVNVISDQKKRKMGLFNTSRVWIQGSHPEVKPYLWAGAAWRGWSAAPVWWRSVCRTGGFVTGPGNKTIKSHHQIQNHQLNDKWQNLLFLLVGVIHRIFFHIFTGKYCPHIATAFCFDLFIFLH